ncbi:hypothetical protein A8B98_25310 [Hymenobacter sp. UV11]|nr:hypothetical protein A8B98_25310 [Hymenobacter sp. UV11]
MTFQWPIFAFMKRSFWYGFGALLLAGPAQAQSLTGAWQGVEDPGAARYYPSVLRVQRGAGEELFGILYEQIGDEPSITVTFQMEGPRTAGGLRLRHVRKLDETGRTSSSYWCGDGEITFTYHAKEEKLTGHATYAPHGDCDTGEFTFYRVRLKSAATVRAGALSTLRVSGRDVRWFADAELKRPVATGNTYPTRLRRTTTFYLTQGYYPTPESPVVPITIQVAGTQPAARPAPVAAAPLPAPRPALTDSALRPAPPAASAPAPAPTPTPAPVVLPTVLFKKGEAELLPEASPALEELAATLRARPGLRLRVAGHTDRVGEPGKNQVLSEQRATAVKEYLVKAGIGPERLDTAGYGDTRPLYPSPDVRNRRVEVSEIP